MQHFSGAPALGDADLEGIDQRQAQKVLVEFARLFGVAAAISVVVKTLDAHRTTSNVRLAWMPRSRTQHLSLLYYAEGEEGPTLVRSPNPLRMAPNHRPTRVGRPP